MVAVHAGSLLLVTQAWIAESFLTTSLERYARVRGCETLLSHRSNPSDERSKREPYSLGLRPFLEKRYLIDQSVLTGGDHAEGLQEGAGSVSTSFRLAVADNSQDLDVSGERTLQLKSILRLEEETMLDSEETHNISVGSSKTEPDSTPTFETVGIDEGMQTLMINKSSHLSPIASNILSPTLAPRTSNSSRKDSTRAQARSKPMEPATPWSAYLQTLNSIYQPSYPKQDKNASVSASGGPGSSSFQDSSSIGLTSPVGSGKKGTDLLTLHDLENILLNRKYVREIDLKQHLTKVESPLLSEGTNAGKSKSLQSLSSSPLSKRIAFPQPSLLDGGTLQWGCTIASGFVSMLVATSLVPNLWLMGALVGGLYGNEVSKRNRAVSVDGDSATESGPLERLVLYLGRRLALLYLRAYDACNALFFMWKTGQLSYEYYQTYATLDERFAIQSKIDAWNAFFVEGKIAFDRWEKENEVGRKILAGLRTAWLVEERSLKKSRRRRQSKYRVVQLIYDAEYFGRRFVRSVWKAVTGGDSKELRDFLKGVRIEITDSQALALGSRLGSVMAAVVAVNLTGALFAISPSLLSFLAVVVGIAWPSWTSEFFDRVALFAEEASARGRGDPKPPIRKVDKSKYHYFITENGKKRYYRTGIPWFESPSNYKTRKKNRKTSSDDGRDWRFLQFPWS